MAEGTIETTIRKVERQVDRSGNPSEWISIQTDDGEFTTRFPEPAQEANQYLGQRVSLSYEETQRLHNGRTYTNRYLKRVQSTPASPVGSIPLADAPQRAGGDMERELRIMRQTAGKIAAQTLPLLPSELRTFQNQVGIAEAWLRYFIGGPDAVQAAPPPDQPAFGDPGPQAPPWVPADDDLPPF